MAKKTYLPKKPTKEKQNEDNLQILKTRLAVSRRYDKTQRDQLKETIKVLDYRREITVGGDTTTQKVKYPLAWAAYENFLSQLTAIPPQVVIEAEGKEDIVKKIFWKGILEYTKRKLRLTDVKEDFIDSFIQAGKAVYKIGRTVETRKGVKEVKGEDGKTIIKQEFEGVVENKSFVEVVDPRRFYMSPETKHYGPVLDEHCPYCIEEMIKTPEHIEKMYGIKVKEEEKELIDPDEEWDKDDTNKTTFPGEKTDDMKRVRLYAYYGVWKGKENQEVLFTTKRIIKERELPYQWGNKKPYLVALNFKKFFRPVARGAMDSILDLDQEYNEHMNRIRTYIRRMVNPKWAKLKGTQVDEDALLDPDTGVVIDESQPNAFRAVTPPSIGAEIFNKATSVEQLFYLLSGIIYGTPALNKVGTATGQKMQEGATDVKLARMIRKIERTQEELETMLLQLEQQYAPKDGTDIRIVGTDVVDMIKNKKFLYKEQLKLWQRQGQQGPPPVDEYEKFALSEDGKSIFTNYTREDIQGQFELTILSQSSNRSDRLIKSQQILNALRESANDPTVNRAELWKRWFVLNEMNDIDNLIAKQPVQQTIPPANGEAQPMQNVKVPNEANLQGAIESQANRIV